MGCCDCGLPVVVPESFRPPCKQIESSHLLIFGVFPGCILVYFPCSWNLFLHEERFVPEKYGTSPELLRCTEPPLPAAAPLPRYYPVSKIVTDRDLGSKRNQDGGFFLFHCDMAFTRLVLAGENTVSTSKGSLTYILTPGLIFLVFPSDTFVSWWCGTRLREPRAHVLVSTKFNACSYLRNHISTVAC